MPRAWGVRDGLSEWFRNYQVEHGKAYRGHRGLCRSAENSKERFGRAQQPGFRKVDPLSLVARRMVDRRLRFELWIDIHRCVAPAHDHRRGATRQVNRAAALRMGAEKPEERLNFRGIAEWASGCTLLHLPNQPYCLFTSDAGKLLQEFCRLSPASK